MEISKRKLPKCEGETYPYYEDGRFTHHITIRDAKDRYISDGKDLGIAITNNYETTIGPLNLKDLKALRKLVRKAIKNYESNEPLQI